MPLGATFVVVVRILMSLRLLWQQQKKRFKMDTRKEKFPYGIPGYNLSEIEREIPSEEPPAWPINDKLKIIGKRITRIDALDKVTGRAIYTSDVKLPGMLYAKMLRSNVPHAVIRSIDITKAKSLPGVHAIHLMENTQKDSVTNQFKASEKT